MTLSQQQGQLSNFVATWTETATATGATATATHAAEAGLSHYITGFAVSAMNGAGETPDEMTCTIQDDTTGIIVVTFHAAVVDDYAPGGPGGIVHEFTNPIVITSGNPTSVKVTGAGGYNVVKANIWGFTSL